MNKTWFDKGRSFLLIPLFAVSLAACSGGLNESPGEAQLEPRLQAGALSLCFKSGWETPYELRYR